MNMAGFFLFVLGWFFIIMAITYSAEPCYCPFYLNDDRLGDRRTVQEYLWQVQCQPSSALKNILYYITILSYAVNKPTSFVLPNSFQMPLPSDKSRSSGSQRYLLVDWNVVLNPPLAYKKAVSPGSMAGSICLIVALCIIPSCSWTAISFG